jgi:hypothetical protein
VLRPIDGVEHSLGIYRGLSAPGSSQCVHSELELFDVAAAVLTHKQVEPRFGSHPPGGVPVN